jgi:hypothetical protein
MVDRDILIHVLTTDPTLTTAEAVERAAELTKALAPPQPEPKPEPKAEPQRASLSQVVSAVRSKPQLGQYATEAEKLDRALANERAILAALNGTDPEAA